VAEFAVILALVLVNGLFAGAEIAVVTLRKTRLQELVDGGSGNARAIATLRARPERFLATVQIGITVIGAAAGAFGGDTVAERLTPHLAQLPLVGAYAHPLAFACVVAGISFLSLVLGELVPKSLALMAPERYALVVARPLVALSTFAGPIVAVLTGASNLVLRLFGDRTSFTESRMSADEIRAMIEDASKRGGLDDRATAIASRAIEFAELDVRDVLVPRHRLSGVRSDANADDVRAAVLASGHSRLLVYGEDVDHVVGSLSVRDLFLRPDRPITALMRPICIVPVTVSAVELLHRMQGKGIHMAVVVDEHGGTVGLVTREDLVEELVGKMDDAEGEAARHATQAAARHHEGGAIDVAAVALVRELNRDFDLALPDGDFTTIGGLIVARLKRIPPAGERITLDDGTVITVTDASARRVKSVRIERPIPEAALASSSA
jgi:putative hemolysin